MMFKINGWNPMNINVSKIEKIDLKQSQDHMNININ
jgi:hypothetical protein